MTQPGAAPDARADGASSPLFRRHPALAGAVPWLSLGTFPTPVEALPLPGGAPDGRLLVKRDGACSPLYGGNKVRKLEHLLARARGRGTTALVTMGGIGSNHAVATAVHGRELGLRTEAVLFHQPVSDEVLGNLRALLHVGARVHYRQGQMAAVLGVRSLARKIRREGESPFPINPGGTSRLGTLGYVNAALELAEQVRAGVLPEPDRIYVALGTGGTAAGLVAGLRLAGLRSRVCAVRVARRIPANRWVVLYYARSVVRWLRSLDPSIPPVAVGPRDFDVETGYLGPDYGVATPPAREAVEWARPPLALETTYTGKTLAACLDYCRTRMRPGEAVLYWNTYTEAPGPRAPSLDGLPPELARRLG